MPRVIPRFLLTLALAVSALGLIGCDGPCRSLAERVCSCEPNNTEQQTCLLKVQIRGDTPVSMAEEARCSELLDSCSCEALADEDYLACGIFDVPASAQ